VSADSDEENPCAGYCDRGACATVDTPDTWINWVKGASVVDGSYLDMEDGAVVVSHHFKVDFQSTATDTGRGSHVDLKIDDSAWMPVASPKTFSIMSYGPHTIYLKGVDKYGNEDPTPATFSFAIQKPRTYPSDDDDTKRIINKIEDLRTT
jgi:hypothetical protein